MIARNPSLRAARLWLAVIALLLPAVSALAIGQGRLQAEVVDGDGKPVADAQVVVTQEQIGYSNTAKTDKRGRFNLLVLDASRVYTFEFTKEGMPKVVETFKIETGGVTRHTFTLVPQAAAGAGPATGSVTSGRSKSINTYNEGVTALQSGDRAGARAKFEEAVELDPEMAEPYSVLGTLYLDAKEYDRAIAAAEKLLELSPDDPAALMVLYDAHDAKGDKAAAQGYLDRLGTAGGGTDAAIRMFNAGADASRAGNLDTAITLFGKAIEIDPELAPAHAASARLLLARERYQDALTAAERAVDIDPDLVEMHRVRYEAYRRLGQDDKAREVFETLASADPEGLAETLYQRGQAAFQAGDTAAAVQALEQAVQAKPDHARAHYWLGLSYANADDKAKAKQHLQKFVELAPDDPEASTAKEMIAYMG
jgi:tetratricopeptide (TPR) repeat protein